MNRLFEIRGPIVPWLRWLLPWIPILAMLASYLAVANLRRAENPRDKLMPLPADFAAAARRAVTANEFTEKVPLWEDLKSSLRLYAMGFALAVAVALVAGLHAGAWTWMHAMLDPLLKILSYLPPISLLPLVLLFLGVGDTAKVFLIFIAVAIPLTRSLVLRVQSINQRQIWNALTLGPSPFEMIWVIIRRIVEPGFLDDVRLLIGTAWVYLIAAELIASNSGLGYRISVAGRNLDIATIFLYIAIISLLAFLMDKGIHAFNRWKNRWNFVS